MTDASGKDRMQRGPAPSSAPQAGAASTTLPKDDPHDAGSIEEQLQDLQASLSELEGTFRFMGTGHPRYEKTQQRIVELRAMLDRLERMQSGA